jgi:hypothetical protein
MKYTCRPLHSKFRTTLVKLCVSSHTLLIEPGRYDTVERIESKSLVGRVDSICVVHLSVGILLL